jgi:MFS family permease
LATIAYATFRNLLVAAVVSDIGAFMQSVGAAWLMVSLNAGPMYVALTQTASSLPFLVFALPAGAIGDIVDRRKLILYTETWMVGVAVVLARIRPGPCLTLDTVHAKTNSLPLTISRRDV